MKKAFFPGSFDPFTKGHEDVIQRGLGLFDSIVIGVGVNSSKTSFFTLESRIAHIQSLFPNESRVEIIHFETLSTKKAISLDCTHLLRGLRDSKDFSYEFPIAILNRQISKLETVFLLPNTDLIGINSSIVREIYKNGGIIDDFVTNRDLLLIH
jgi:pantetheine-phosphate adenylyltransferase